MSTQISLNNFEEIYARTYQCTLKYIVLHCSNMEDVNDIIQDTYVELYKSIKRKERINLENEQSFIIGIANHVLNKHYRNKYKAKIISPENYGNNENYGENAIENFSYNNYNNDDFDQNLELQFITKENVAKIWEYISKKDEKVAKVFYLYYGLDMKITDIAKELKITESATKNYIYRTVRELKSIFNKESDEDAKQ